MGRVSLPRLQAGQCRRTARQIRQTAWPLFSRTRRDAAAAVRRAFCSRWRDRHRGRRRAFLRCAADAAAPSGEPDPQARGGDTGAPHPVRHAGRAGWARAVGSTADRKAGFARNVRNRGKPRRPHPVTFDTRPGRGEALAEPCRARLDRRHRRKIAGRFLISPASAQWSR